MAKAICIASAAAGETSSTTNATFFKIAGLLHSQTTETSCDVLSRTAGTNSNLFLRVITNAGGANCTVKSRKNAADGNLTTTIGIAATGVFEDTSNSDSITAGDKICITCPTTATGLITFTIMSLVFDSSISSSVHFQVNGGSSTALSAASTTYFMPTNGRPQANTTESQTKVRIRKSATYANLGMYLISNSRTTNTVWTSRKNGSDGNLTVTFGNVETGWKEDTTHSDSVAAGDDYNMKIVTGTGTQTFNWKVMKLEFTSSAGDAIQIQSDTPFGQNDNLVRYFPISGQLANTSTEADVKTKTRIDGTMSELECLITANTINASGTAIKTRKSGSDGNCVLQPGSNATGLISDTTHSDTTTTTNDINISCSTASVAGTQTMTLGWIAVNYNIVTLTQVNQTFTHLYKIVGRANQTFTHKYKIVGRAAQTFTHKYKIRSLASQVFTHKYKIVGRANKTFTHLYKIVGRANQTFTYKYKIVGRANQTFTHLYKIRKLATQSFTHKYKIIGRATQSFIHKYKIIGRATQSYIHKYKIVGRASQTFTHLYKIRQLATQTYTHKYKIRQLASSTYTHLYKIVGRVAQTYTYLYKIRSLVNQTYTHKYKIIGRASQIYTHIYKIVGRANQVYTHKYAIKQLASQTFTHKYKLRQLATQSFTHIYKIISEQLRATQSFTHIYKIVGRTNQTFTHKYNILSLVNQTYTHKYNIKQLASKTFTHIYKLRQLATNTFTHKYKLRQLVNQVFTHKYKIIGRIAQIYTHLYKIRQLATQTYTHKYRLLILVNQSYTHKYRILNLVNQTFTFKYAIRGLVSQTFTHIYKIFSNLFPVSQTFTHIYKIRKLPDLIPLYKQSTVRKIESGFNAFMQRSRFRESESYLRQLGGKVKRKRATGRVGRTG